MAIENSKLVLINLFYYGVMIAYGWEWWPNEKEGNLKTEIFLLQAIHKSNIRQHIKLKRCVRKSTENYLQFKNSEDSVVTGDFSWAAGHGSARRNQRHFPYFSRNIRMLVLSGHFEHFLYKRLGASCSKDG